MEKELLNNEKQLLLQDLCARLPYGVKVKIKYHDDVWKLLAIYTNGTTYATRDIGYPIETYFEDCKPYLFPLSSMTEEQKNQLERLWSDDMDKAMDYAISGEERSSGLCELSAARKVINWLIANHFDYHGLIPMGLALDATGLNIY